MQNILKRQPVAIFLFLSTFVLFIFISVEATSAETIYVDDGAPDGGDGSKYDPYDTIAEGINRASSGDTVRVYAGDYYENLDVSNDISIVGNGSSTVVDSSSVENEHTVFISSDYVTLRSMKIRGAQSDERAGIYISYSSLVEIDDCVVEDCNYGIWIFHGDNNTVSDCTVSNITKRGIELLHNYDNTVSWSHVSNCDYGLFLYNSTNNAILQSAFLATTNNFGLYLSMSHGNYFEECNFSQSASYGAYIFESHRNTFRGCQFYLNDNTGISSHVSSHNRFFDCGITGKWGTLSDGFYFDGSHNNTVYGGFIREYYDGIDMWQSPDNLVRAMLIEGCNRSVRAVGSHNLEITGNLMRKIEGHDYDYGIYLQNCHFPVIYRNRLEGPDDLDNRGILLANSDYAGITWNFITSWEWGIVIMDYSGDSCVNPCIQYNDIRGCLDSGLDGSANNAAEKIDARHNWWGDDTGPYHDPENLGGQANGASGNVLINPWLDGTALEFDYYTVSLPEGAPTTGLDGSFLLPFPTINYTLMVVGNGSSVKVFDGYYRENPEIWVGVSFTGNIINQGESNAYIPDDYSVRPRENWHRHEDIFLDATMSNHGITINTRDVHITGFHITNVSSGTRSDGHAGIYGYMADYGNVTGNRIHAAHYGIYLIGAEGWWLKTNVIEDCRYGIYLDSIEGDNTCDNNLLRENEIRWNSEHGIYVDHGEFNTIRDNNVYSNTRDGINLYYSKYNVLFYNSLNSNYDSGIRDYYGYNNKYIDNYAGWQRQGYGLILESCNWNTLEGNYLEYNLYDFGMNGTLNGHFYHWVSDNNTAGPGVIQLLRGRTSYTINPESDPSTIILVECDNITVSKVSLEGNMHGLLVVDSESVVVEYSSMHGNRYGIYTHSDVTGLSANYNNISGNRDYGIYSDAVGGDTFNCTGNWWGSTEGPYHSDMNPDGNGDSVEGSIDFSQWLEEPFAMPRAVIEKITPAGLSNEGEEVSFTGRGYSERRARAMVFAETAGMWRLDSGSGASPTLDDSGNDMDGEVFGPQVVGGRFDNSMSFDGEGSYIRVDDDGTFAMGDSDFTIDLWIRPGFNTWSNYQALVSQFDPQNGAFIRAGISDHHLYLSMQDDTGEYFETGWWDRWVEDGVWHHVAFVKNSTHVKFYIDGESSTGQWEHGLGDFGTGGNLTFGATEHEEGENDWYNGEMDEVRITQRSLAPGLIFRYAPSLQEYWWMSSIGGNLSSISTFSTNSLSGGDHNINFRVHNGIIWSPADQQAHRVNLFPTALIDSISPDSVTEGDEVEFRGSAVDDDGDVEEYRWTSNIDGFLSDQNQFTTADLSNGTHQIYFRARDDSDAWSDPEEYTVTINGRPRAFIGAISPDVALKGEQISFSATADDDTGIDEHEWYSDIDGLLSTRQTFTADNLSLGVHDITFWVIDADGVEAEDHAQLTVTERPTATIDYDASDLPPGILDGPVTIVEGSTIVLAGEGSDDGEVVDYIWSSSLDGELGRGKTLTYNQLSNGTHLISLETVDNDGLVSLPVNLANNIRVNGRPRATIIDYQEISVWNVDKIRFAGSGFDDRGNENMMYVWQSSLEGKEFYNGTDSGFTTGSLNIGTHLIRFFVIDGEGVASKTETVQIYVDEGDGIYWDADLFPDDPAASMDSDGDGYPDDWNPGMDADDSTTNLSRDGFPDDPAAGLDSDGDGFPDNWNDEMGQGDSTTGIDHKDVFPYDPAASVDSDKDGYPDGWNPGSNSKDSTSFPPLQLDAFRNDPDEWKDSDDDGVGDNGDLDDDGDGYNDAFEIATLESDPLLHSRFIYDGKYLIKNYTHTPDPPSMRQKIRLELEIIADSREAAPSVILYYRTRIQGWEVIDNDLDVETVKDVNIMGPLVNDLQREDLLAQDPDYTYAIVYIYSYEFPVGFFTTGEEIRYYFEIVFAADDIRYSPGSGRDGPETFTVVSKVEIVRGVTPEFIISLVGSVVITSLLLHYRFYRRFERVNYIDYFIGEDGHPRVTVKKMFNWGTVRKLLKVERYGKVVKLIYFIGLCGLLMLAFETFILPEEISEFSIIMLALFLGTSIIIPFFYAYFTSWKKKLPVVGKLAMVVGYAASVVILFMFVIPNYFAERENLNYFGEEAEYAYLAAFFLLFGVPMVLYANILGTNWNFLVFNFYREFREGYDHLSWRRSTPARRIFSFFMFFAIVLMPILSINALIALFSGNYSQGGYIGITTTNLIEQMGYDEFAELASRFIAIFIVLNVVIIGAAMVFRVVQLQFFNSQYFSGRFGLKFKHHGKVADSPEDQTTLILFVFGIFFGYSILLLILSIYAHFGDLMPVVPYLSQRTLQVIMIAMSAASNALFLLFWVFSVTKIRRVFKIARTKDGKGFYFKIKTRKPTRVKDHLVLEVEEIEEVDEVEMAEMVESYMPMEDIPRSAVADVKPMDLEKMGVIPVVIGGNDVVGDPGLIKVEQPEKGMLESVVKGIGDLPLIQNIPHLVQELKEHRKPDRRIKVVVRDDEAAEPAEPMEPAEPAEATEPAETSKPTEPPAHPGTISPFDLRVEMPVTTEEPEEAEGPKEPEGTPLKDVAGQPAQDWVCGSCGKMGNAANKFCTNCGASR